MLPKIAKYFHRLIHHVEFSGITTEFCKEWSREAYPKLQSILCQGPAYGQFGQTYFEILRRIFVSEYTTSRLSFFLVRQAKRARQKNDHARD